MKNRRPQPFPWYIASAAVAACGAVLVLAQMAGVLNPADSARISLPIAGVFAAVVGIAGVHEAVNRARRDGGEDALVDPQSGLTTPQVAERMLAHEFAAAQNGRPLCVVLFRIDRFAHYVRLNGRKAGDAALREFGATLARRTRAMNMVARYPTGDATFLAILSDMPLEGACVFADRMRDELASLHSAGDLGTVSAGLAAYEPAMSSQRVLLERAERALGMTGAEGGWIVAVGEGGLGLAAVETVKASK
jgi:diguanylate cyclase (GGDEF)-like protein